MKAATNRSIVPWIHIVFSVPILGYIYSPIEEIPALRENSKERPIGGDLRVLPFLGFPAPDWARRQ